MDRERNCRVGNKYIAFIVIAICFASCKDAPKEQIQKEEVVAIVEEPKELVEFGFEESLVLDWIKVRKTKKATNTETALKNFLNEISKRKCKLTLIM